MNESNPHNKSQLQSVLLGVLLGVGVTLLFTSKKGKKILRALTDEGLDKVAGLQDLFQVEEEDEEIQESGPEKKTVKKEVEEELSSDPPRFFKGIPKRSTSN